MTGPTSPPRRRRPDWAPRFLELFRATGNVRLAADGAGIDRTTVYARADRDPAFDAAWRSAADDATDLLLAEARRRGLAGSDALLALLLRALRPDLFHESLDVRIDVRRQAAQIATRLGVPVEEVLERVERRARELR